MKVTQDLKLVLDDQQTVDELKEADVMPVIREEKRTPKPHTFTMHLTDAQVERLSRLNSQGDWHAAVTDCIESLMDDRIGKATISRPSQFSQRVTGPSNGANFR